MFTNTQIKNLKPKAKPYRLYEKSADPGFHVQVSTGGKVTFGVAYTINSKKRFYNLGTYSSKFGLAEARDACRAARSVVDQGLDPQVEHKKRVQHQEQERQQQELDKNAVTVNELLDYYLTTLSNENTLKNTEQQFASDVRPLIGKIKARDLTDDDVAPVIDAVVNRGAQTSARNLFISLNSAFNKAKKKADFHLKKWDNPLQYIDKPKAGDPTDRALTAEQVKTYWQTLNNYTGMDESIKDALRIILLTGQRVQEILGLRWSEVNLDELVIDIPAERIKTGKKTRSGHVIPITPMVAEILQRQPRQGKAVFPGRKDGDTPYNWQSATTAVARMLKQLDDFPKFSPRDTRSTVKTHMARIKVMKEIRDRIQNHALHDVATKHYDRYDYLDEKRHGLELWQNELQRIIGLNITNNVVTLNKGAKNV